jgi:hypothetical protein
MKHKLEFLFTQNNDWSLTAFHNNQLISSLETIPINWHFDFDIENYNVLMLFFTKRNHEGSGFKILNVLYNHIDIGNSLYNTEFLSSHAEYSKLTPCMDINLSGVWFLRFNKNFGNELIRRYT